MDDHCLLSSVMLLANTRKKSAKTVKTSNNIKKNFKFVLQGTLEVIFRTICRICQIAKLSYTTNLVAVSVIIIRDLKNSYWMFVFIRNSNLTLFTCFQYQILQIWSYYVCPLSSIRPQIVINYPVLKSLNSFYPGYSLSSFFTSPCRYTFNDILC